MPGHPRLYRRGAVYYFRAAIPVDIKETYPKSEETFSLRTKDRQEALKRVRQESARVDQLFERHRRELALQDGPPLLELSDTQIEMIGELYYAFRLEEDEETRLDGFYDPDEPLLDAPRPSFEEYADLVETHEEINRANYARGKQDAFFRSEAEEVLSWSTVNLRLDPSSPSWPKLVRTLQVSSIRAAVAVRSRNEGHIVETPKTQGAEVQALDTRLSDAVDAWANEKARTSWVAKTEREHRVWMGHFMSIVGDRPISSYTKADARAFRNVLLRLPSNWSKYDDLQGLPVQKAADKAEELGLTPMAETNVNKLLGFVASFWNWAEGQYDEVPANLFKGMKIRTNRDVREERDPFSVEELGALFNAPIYTGCQSAASWRHSGNLVLRDSGLFWVPLIALYTGARLGEIIQLYTDDIREEQGVRFFDINRDGDDKRLKNANSRRRIPIHSNLIAYGLLKLHARRLEQGEQRLFPDLQMGSDGYYSSPFSKHFRRFLESVGVKHRKNAFHSFRHSFQDACRNSGLRSEVMDALQGHGEKGMKRRYGEGYSLRVLDEAMQALEYHGLDLSHLHDA